MDRYEIINEIMTGEHITIINGERFGWLLGELLKKHKAAEAQLEKVREIVKGTNPDGLTHYQTQQVQIALQEKE